MRIARVVALLAAALATGCGILANPIEVSAPAVSDVPVDDGAPIVATRESTYSPTCADHEATRDVVSAPAEVRAALEEVDRRTLFEEYPDSWETAVSPVEQQLCDWLTVEVDAAAERAGKDPADDAVWLSWKVLTEGATYPGDGAGDMIASACFAGNPWAIVDNEGLLSTDGS